ncbi:hypothetical protein FSP39_018176 [Pinctada imbricata]|uniref:Uncharacterized protein n=1 Tax=Pinctada imbricata TaxID=66713 RepID=A0AA88YGM4_PINIB|nr:hypothetical protein FSP39_018176 [Pinctada imbricata]
MATGGAEVTEEEVNYSRFSIGVLKVTPQVLRLVFKSRHPDLKTFLAQNKSKCQQLRNSRVLTKDQWNQLYPATEHLGSFFRRHSEHTFRKKNEKEKKKNDEKKTKKNNGVMWLCSGRHVLKPWQSKSEEGRYNVRQTNKRGRENHPFYLDMIARKGIIE